METLKNIKVFLKNKFRKQQNSFIEFSDFFLSEKIFDFFGFNNFPKIFSRRETTRKKVIFLTAILSLIVLTILLLTSATIGFTKSGAVITLAENICTIAGMTVIIVKVYSILYLYRENVRDIIGTLETYYPQNGWNQQVFQVSSHLKNYKILSRTGVFCYVISFVMFNFIPIFSQLYWLITSQEFDLTPIFNFYMPFEQNHLLPYTFLNTIAIVSHSSGLSFIFMTDLLYAELVALTAMEFNILGHMISEIDPEDDQEKAFDDLKNLVKVHKKLIEVTGKLQGVFSLILFMDLFGIIGMMCTLAFLSFAGISKLFFIRYLFLFLGASWNAFNHCFYGDRLNDASRKVAEDVYNSPWLHGNKKYRKLIQFIMLRAQSEQQLSGFNFLFANLETFQWISNLTYSYYTVLVTLYESA